MKTNIKGEIDTMSKKYNHFPVCFLPCMWTKHLAIITYARLFAIC
jgi:hypothetical protein